MSGEDTAHSDEVKAELQRGQRLDRQLARQLGRPEPTAAPAGAGTVEWLRRRPIATEHELIARAQAGDRAAKGQLVEAYLPLISSVARTYRGGHIGRVELLQEGVVGVLRALESFDLERGTPFWAYASWWVRQAMQQLVAELTRPVVLSDRALRHLARVKDVQRQAVRRSGQEPTRAELIERSGLSGQQLDDLLAAERPARSLDEPITGAEGAIGTFGDLLVDPLAEGEYERVLDTIEAEELHRLLSGLSERDREVLRARFGVDGPEQTLREVGARLGLSGERVRQIERRALAKLSSAAGVDAEPQPA